MIHTTGTAGREVGYTPDWLRRLEAQGVVRPTRDALGRRLYTEQDLATLRDHKERCQRRRRGAKEGR